MTQYCAVHLSTAARLSDPGPAPTELDGWPDEALADVAAAVDPCPEQWRGVGFWPVVVPVPMEHDPETQRLSTETDLTVDVGDRRVLAVPLVVNLTTDEIQERQRTKALADLAALDAVLPRATEDVVAVLTEAQRAALPPILRERLAAKARARTVLAGGA